MSETNLVPGRNKDNNQVILLTEQVDDLLDTFNPFVFRAKLDSVLLSDPTDILKILLDKFPNEKRYRQSENIIMVMGWTGSAISQKEEISNEEKSLLRKSFDNVIDTTRNNEWLAHHMTAAHTLFSFQFNDEHINIALQDLARDIFTIMAQRNQSGAVVETYKPRGYAQDNDLLENIIEKLEENGARDEETLRKIAETSTEKEGYLRLRIIYKSRQFLADKSK